MRPHILRTKSIIHRPIQEVFTFFSKAENLQLMCPPELSFTILTPLPIEMQQGTIIDYKLSLSGFPFYWKTKITEWKDGESFTDEQVKGPYRMWQHTHFFKDLGNHTTEMTDEVLFLSPGWILEPILHHLWVKHQVENIFSYRENKLKQLFP